eukprot:GHVT01042542.1.p1 GENE.GHVT01042542.1~~GHVT01042542.1.p1  ORF type:complete len:227 (-),score=72.45 GHVT01042542.1:1000-1680(-)
MPATVGRMRMPADNRVSTSVSLKTSEIWQKSVGYDPYAPTEVPADRNAEEAVEKARGLFQLARLTGNTSSITPGACQKCNQLGHLSFQCRNMLAVSETAAGSLGKSQRHEDDSEVDEEEERKERQRLGLLDSDDAPPNDQREVRRSRAEKKAAKTSKKEKKKKEESRSKRRRRRSPSSSSSSSRGSSSSSSSDEEERRRRRRKARRKAHGKSRSGEGESRRHSRRD